MKRHYATHHVLVKDAVGTCFCVFFRIVAVPDTNVGVCTSNQTMCLGFPCACFMFEIQTVKPKILQIASVPC